MTLSLPLKRLAAGAAFAAASLAFAAPASAFCGFYVAKADTSLFNEASKVALVRDGERTVMTMAADYQGEPSEFAMVLPVNDVPERGQINVADPGLIERIDAYTAPRLVEYHDENPCMAKMRAVAMATSSAPAPMALDADDLAAEELGVTVEAEYEVGEYDIQILSAEQSDGLLRYLDQEGYTLPDGAEDIVGSYLKQGLNFFVAKVNLERNAGKQFLRPIQIAYEDEDYMLPIRLGTVNAQGKQELFVFAMSREGRTEVVNYKTKKIPSDMDVPVYIADEFGDFYRDMFRHQVEEADGRAVFMEYAWDMAWCDPCAADPLSPSELRELGVMWLDEGQEDRPVRPMPRPMPGFRPGLRPQPQPVDVFVTRLHLRYDAETFPEDLRLQVTGDRENYQGRYVLRHAWRGDYDSCEAARDYAAGLVERWDEEAETLAELTGRDLDAIKANMREAGLSADSLDIELGTDTKPQTRWWDRLWGR